MKEYALLASLIAKICPYICLNVTYGKLKVTD